MRISALHTKDNEVIPLGKFTVLVGPNNVGKSQTLRDIQMRMDSGGDARTTLITDIDLEKPPTFEVLLDGLQVVEDPERLQMHVVRGIRSNLQSGDAMQLSLENLQQRYNQAPNMRFMLGHLARYRVSFLDITTKVAELLDQLQANQHGLSGVRGALNRIYGESKKWSAIKRMGISAFPANQRETVQKLVDDLKAEGLFVVPVGSLEGWLELGTQRKNRWIVLALEALNQNKCSKSLKNFVSDVLASMDAAARPAEAAPAGVAAPAR